MSAAFVGRAEEMERLRGLGASLVTLWGPGGVGKTRLAEEHAGHERACGRAVAWVDLAAAHTRPETVSALASALGLALSAREDDVDALARAAAAQGGLLVADNVEQLDAEARRVIVYLAEAGARVLVTSREVLGATGEITIAVAPLSEDDGVTLFERLVGAAGGLRSPPASDAAVTRAIVRRLDALPLAIELAAARAPLLGAAELLARLDRKLDLLGSASDARPARHATLRAAIDWSWELLDDGEREALMACATFEAPFDASLAEAVIGGREADALDVLERLRSRALIHAHVDDRGRTTARLLESVRDYAREASVIAGIVTELSERHDRAIVARSEPLAEAARCGGDVVLEFDTLRADLLCATRAPKGGETAARAALALAALLSVTGPLEAAVEVLEGSILRAATDANRTASADAGVQEILARLHWANGDALRALGRLDEASAALKTAAKAARALGDGPRARTVAADAERVLGSVLRSHGRSEEALRHKESALATYRALGDRAREGICLGEMGSVLQSEGRLALARRRHAEAIAIHVAMGSLRAEGVERSYLAVATHRAGDPAESLALHEGALAIHRDVRHRRLEGAERLHLAFAHHELGSLVVARHAFAEARSVLASAGARGLEALALVFGARLELDAGEGTTALLMLAAARQVAPRSWPRVDATRQLVEGHLAMSRGDAASARDAYEASLATSRHVEVGFEALTPAYLALALARAGGTGGERHLDEAHAAAAIHENPHLAVAAKILAAAARGEPAPAVDTLASSASSEVRRALAFAGTPRGLVVDSGGKRVVLPDGRAIDLSRRKNVRLVLIALADARRDRPGAAVSPTALLAAGWPGERMRPDAATKRLHTAIWTLRSLGLDGLLVTEGEGYMLDPRTNLVASES